MLARTIQRAGLPLTARLVLCFFVFSGTSTAYAQSSPMNLAANYLIGPIVRSKQRKLAIFDFSGPDGKMTALGQILAADLRASMAKSAGNLKVEDRTRIEEARKKYSYAPGIVSYLPAARMFAHLLGASAFVSGVLSLGKNNVLNVDLRAYRVGNGKAIKAVRVSFPVSKGISKLMAKNVGIYNFSSVDKDVTHVLSPTDKKALADLDADLSSKYPAAHSPGYSSPKCVFCPFPPYTDEALTNGISGFVLLAAVIDKNGRVTDIAVIKGLPGGLMARAVETVRGWKLKSAKGPGGKPAAVAVFIVLRFEFF